MSNAQKSHAESKNYIYNQTVYFIVGPAHFFRNIINVNIDIECE